MIKRKVKFTVGNGVIDPSVPLYGGVKGEHNATLLRVELADDVYTAGDEVRLSFTTGDGTILSSDLFEAEEIRTDENGKTYIEYELPQLLTVAAGQLCVRVVTSGIDESGAEGHTYRSPEMVLYFDEAEVENGTPFWTGVSEMLRRTVTASGAAVNAQDAAQGAQRNAEEYAVSAQDAKTTAEAARDEAQAAKGIAEDARDLAKLYAESAVDAEDAAKTARDEAQDFAKTAASARDAAVTNAGKAGNFATAAQQAQSAAETAKADAEGFAQEAETQSGYALLRAERAETAVKAAEAARDEAQSAAEDAHDNAATAGEQAVDAKKYAASAWEAVETPGRKGEDGKSAYQIALDNGFEGDEAAWLASLKGEDGVTPTDTLCYKGTIAGTLLMTLTDQQIGDVWFAVSSGENGNRFYMWDGTDWTPLATGTQGEKGDNGTTPHIGENGNWYIGETDTGVKAKGEDGKNGKSAYEIAMDYGEARDEEEWLASLKGDSYVLTDADKVEIADDVLAKLGEEEWTFMLEDGTTVTKAVVLK